MINIPNPDYGQLEQSVGLLLHIGRDIKRRDKAGFNVNVELSGEHLAKQSIASPERLRAYEKLQQLELIKITDSKTYKDYDGEATFHEVILTEKGRILYQLVEEAYGSMLNSVAPNF